MLLDRSPLGIASPFDLHTLGTPLAFVLSQDQTLHMITFTRSLPRAGRRFPSRRKERFSPPPLLAGQSLGRTGRRFDQGCPRTVLACALRSSVSRREAGATGKEPYLVISHCLVVKEPGPAS